MWTLRNGVSTFRTARWQMAFLDRLVEGAIILKIKGKSYRAEKAKALENPAT